MSEKKLSKQQKALLLMAYENRQEHGEPQYRITKRAVDLYNHEALHGLYGWEYVVPRDYYGKKTRFSVAAIGAAEYNAKRASLSRAKVRLEARGLVVCVWGVFAKWAGITLTAQGIETVKKIAQGANVNRF